MERRNPSDGWERRRKHAARVLGLQGGHRARPSLGFAGISTPALAGYAEVILLLALFSSIDP